MRRAARVLALTCLALIALAPAPARAADTKHFERPELGIAFDAPAKWSIGPGEPRRVLPNEVFDIRAAGSPTTGFSVAVYRLDPPVTTDTLDAALTQLDKQAQAWVATLPGGTMTAIYDAVVDDADGREYEYEYQVEGRTIHADMVVVPNADRAVEISQWALGEEYPRQAAIFDAIFDTLVLPWTKPAA